MLDVCQAEAQQVLNELWSEELLPFQLTAEKISEEIDEYTIHFFDSRMRSVCVPRAIDSPFKESVRTAVLDRVARMSGPITSRLRLR
ncbi:MAG: hypothetical protein QOH41_2536 [Blastocatellia bacterium]|nr:hypothetical protein [Blastocatellia bacterium]